MNAENQTDNRNELEKKHNNQNPLENSKDTQGADKTQVMQEETQIGPIEFIPLIDNQNKRAKFDSAKSEKRQNKNEPEFDPNSLKNRPENQTKLNSAIEKVNRLHNFLVGATGLISLPFGFGILFANYFWIADLFVNFLPQIFVIGVVLIAINSLLGFILQAVLERIELKIVNPNSNSNSNSDSNSSPNSKSNTNPKSKIHSNWFVKILETVSLFTLAGSGFLVLQYYYQPHTNNIDKSMVSSESKLKVGFYNFLYYNQEFEEVDKMLTRLDLDVIGFVEFDQEKANKLEILKKYPHKMVDGDENLAAQKQGNQVAIYSKYELTNELNSKSAGELIKLETNHKLGSMISGVATKNKVEYRLVFVHTPAPVSQKLWEQRNSFNKAIPILLSQLKDNSKTGSKTEPTGEQIILMGDFNTTPFSPHMPQLDPIGVPMTTNYIDTLRSSGPVFTWSSSIGGIFRPANNPQNNSQNNPQNKPQSSSFFSPTFNPLTVHIDHSFVSRNLMVVDSKVDEKAGSDHNLIWVEVK